MELKGSGQNGACATPSQLSQEKMTGAAILPTESPAKAVAPFWPMDSGNYRAEPGERALRSTKWTGQMKFFRGYHSALGAMMGACKTVSHQ